VIIAIGILLLISGTLVLVLGPNKLRPMIGWFQKQSGVLARAMALIVLAIGVVIIISV
jgi:Sec-independent protein translocase protein TatA